MNVQAYILTLTYETTLEELLERVEQSGYDTITEIVAMNNNDILSYVSPIWASAGDIIFFYYAKSSINTIKRLKKESDLLNDYDIDKPMYKGVLKEAEDMYNKIGGCIFAVGKVMDSSFVGNGVEHAHFKSKIFAPISYVVNLKNPIPINNFSKYLTFAFRQSITPVLGSSFEALKEDILKNDHINYLADAYAVPIPLKNISDENWISLTEEYRRKFFLEIQFRKYYVDYFLKVFGDNKKFYEECACFRNGKYTGKVDNCIKFNGKYAFVEAKLNVKFVKHFNEQLNRYCEIDEVKLTDEKAERKENIIQEFVFVIDTEGFYIYVHKTQELKRIEFLDNIKCNYDIRALKELCIRKIGS